jgi:hypothetical protein
VGKVTIYGLRKAKELIFNGIGMNMISVDGFEIKRWKDLNYYK